MAPTRVEQGTIIILDVGRNVATAEEKNENSFFDDARACTIKILERKIISQPKSYIGIILLGSKATKNNMAEQNDGVFRHIELFKELQCPTWQMIRDLPNVPTKSKGDWFESILVAVDHFQNGVFNVKILNKKIILMSNLETNVQVDEEHFNQALEGLKDENFELDVIGPDVYAKTKNENIILARRFVEETNGATETFCGIMSYLNFHRKKATNCVPWNVDLSIGPNIKIPVSSYIRLRDEPIMKNWRKQIVNPVTCEGSTTEAIVRNKEYINTETQANKKAEDTKFAYQYGQKYIPIDNLNKNLFYQSGIKCLSIYGFTHKSKINWQNFNNDDGLSYVFGRKGDKNAQTALRCLVECLIELELVGIARRVYNNNNAPKMYALMPVIDASNNIVCLSMAGINFKEDIKYMAFPQTNLKKYACVDEQVNAFKDLIEAMDLTKTYDDSYDDSEAFPIAETVSPNAQYVLDCIAFRAMNPGKPLPQPRDDIMMLLKVPSQIEKKSRLALEKVKSVFNLKKVEYKPKKQKEPSYIGPDNNLLISDQSDTKPLDIMPKIQLPASKNGEIDRIGTLDPVNDFKVLLKAGKTLKDLSEEMIDVLEAIINFDCNFDGSYSKALETMSYFRAECVRVEPEYYNNWLKKLKTDLAERGNTDFLNRIFDNKLNFITKVENNLSTYDNEDTHDESLLYENDTQPNSTDLVISSEMNDIFDDM